MKPKGILFTFMRALKYDDGGKIKKYALVPGKIISNTDGDEHFISASMLASLYGVPLDECIVIDYRQTLTGRHLATQRAKDAGLIILTPQQSAGLYNVEHQEHIQIASKHWPNYKGRV